MNKPRKKLHMHFVGIKGVGMAPLALIAKEAGFRVTGSDIADEFITDKALRKADITPFVGFSPEHIDSPDLVITTGANGGFDNIEVTTAKAKGIEVITQGEAVGLFMEGKYFKKKFMGISVAGTHGKTTTSAMVATILKENGYDPSFVIGTGNVGSLGAPGHFGKGKFFVAEADEYATEPRYLKKAKLLWQHPQIAIITNIEFDHPDMYDSIVDVLRTFLEFITQLSETSVLVACGDDREVNIILKGYTKKVVTYGFNPTNNYVLERVSISGDQTFFWVKAYDASLGEFILRVPGEHNALNALAAVIACLESGVPLEKIKNGLKAFQGSKRRLEFIGDLKTGAKVYDDYAHHPTEITKTLGALRKQYPKKKIVCVFQPHTYSRTKSLFSDFLRVFEDVDTVIICDIYASLREEPDPSVTSARLVESMKKYHRDIKYLPNLSDVVKYINEKRFRPDTILVTMGAGDVYTIHGELSFI